MSDAGGADRDTDASGHGDDREPAGDGDEVTTDGPRIEILAGGEPSPEELAALVVALTPSGGGASDTGANADGGPGAIAAWHRAALLEGVGDAAPINSAADLAHRRT